MSWWLWTNSFRGAGVSSYVFPSQPFSQVPSLLREQLSVCQRCRSQGQNRWSAHTSRESNDYQCVIESAMYVCCYNMALYNKRCRSPQSNTHTINQMRIQYKDVASVALLANKAAARREVVMCLQTRQNRTQNNKQTKHEPSRLQPS